MFKTDFLRRFVLKYLREGIIFIHYPIENFPLNLLLKEFLKLVYNCQSYGRKTAHMVFLTHSVCIYTVLAMEIA